MLPNNKHQASKKYMLFKRKAILTSICVPATSFPKKSYRSFPGTAAKPSSRTCSTATAHFMDRTESVAMIVTWSFASIDLSSLSGFAFIACSNTVAEFSKSCSLVVREVISVQEKWKGRSVFLFRDLENAKSGYDARS